VQSGGYRAVAAGARHTCAVRIDGTVECWGSNGTRQLGTKQSGPLPSPVEVGSFDAAVDVAATYNHTCVETNAEAWCWGLNNYEQTGVDGTSNVPQPRQATPLQDVRDVAAGNHHSCAVLTTGDGRCWGSREFGKLGDGTSGPGSKDSPVAVAHTSNFVLLAAGSGHTCGLDEAGDVWCWGSPSSGKLGRGFGGSIPSTAPPSSEPRRVESSAGGALDDVVDLGSGGDHTCAVLQSGRVRCWGDGSDGQIGDGTTNNYSLATETQGIDDARRVAAGSGHTCVVRTNGSVACWGSNARGQLGTGDTRDRTTPTDVPNLSEVVDLAAGRQHTCAVTTTGALYCWGDNQSGQIGRGTTSTGSVVAPDRVGP
jgi:alpha-tubulin suppressor-like RCC1 family protein